MKKKTLLGLVGLLALVLLSIIVVAADNGYDLSWWSIDGGGGASLGGSYTLDGTLGQPDAGSPSSGGGYTLAGGFWHGSVIVQPGMFRFFLPLIGR